MTELCTVVMSTAFAMDVRSIPDTWVTDYTGDKGNSIGVNGLLCAAGCLPAQDLQVPISIDVTAGEDNTNFAADHLIAFLHECSK